MKFNCNPGKTPKAINYLALPITNLALYIGLCVYYNYAGKHTYLLLYLLLIFPIISFYIALFSKRSRRVEEVSFDDSNSELIIVYNYFGLREFRVLKRIIKVKYSVLKFKFGLSIKVNSSLRLALFDALEFYKSGELLVEIRFQNNTGWTKGRVLEIKKHLSERCKEIPPG